MFRLMPKSRATTWKSWGRRVSTRRDATGHATSEVEPAEARVVRESPSASPGGTIVADDSAHRPRSECVG